MGANLAGLPALSLPYHSTNIPVVTSPHSMSVTRNKGDETTVPMPIGMQLIGRWYDEVTVLRVAKCIEEVEVYS